MGTYVYSGMLLLFFSFGLVCGLILEGCMKDRRYEDEVLKLIAANKRLQEELNLLLNRRKR